MIDGYVRVVSGWLGVEPTEVRAAMRTGGSRVVVEVEGAWRNRIICVPRHGCQLQTRT